MILSNKNILVTGATGFVGAHLVEELVKQKAQVVSTTHHPILKKSYFATQKLDKKTQVVELNLCQFDQLDKLVKEYQFDCIFHLAAQPLVDVAFENPKETLYSNILGTVNVLESARRAGYVKAIVVASSDKAYGKINVYANNRISQTSAKHDKIFADRFLSEIGRPDGGKKAASRASSGARKFLSASNCSEEIRLKYLESDPLAGDHPYEVSKSATDLIAQTYFKTYGLPVVVTRFGNIYGEGDLHFSRLIPGIMKAMTKHEVFEIRSNGKYVRDYLYVKDVIRGYLLLAENIKRVKGEAFNFGSDDTYSVLDLIKLISQISQIPLKYKILNIARNEIPYQSLDWSKIEKTLGWKPEDKIESTIKKIYSWYKNYFR